MRLPNSLSVRLVLVMSLWSVFALAVTGLLISNFYRNRAETDFRELLLAHAYNLMGAVDADSTGALKSTPSLGDPRFLAPGSGWYWAVAAADRPERPLLSSPALARETLDLPPTSEIPFDDVFRRTYVQVDQAGLRVQRLEAQLYFGEADKLFQVMISGNRSELERGIGEFNRYLFLFLGLFCAGTIVATALIIRFGFRPLVEATDALIAVRHGEADHVKGDFPAEIKPFVSATNDLIAANRDVLERSRTQVGNLAHALKTPLAVVINESAAGIGVRNERIGGQAQLMQQQITSYLSKAQISAQRRTITAGTAVMPAIEKLAATMAKLFRHVDFDVEPIESDLSFRGELHDFEEIVGNLLENAAKHANAYVRISVQSADTDIPSIQMVVDDDGPGIAPEEFDEAVQRGVRLDETTPGSGLGLSIVRDIVDDYGGRLEMEESDLGGLKVAVFLPRMAGSSQRSAS